MNEQDLHKIYITPPRNFLPILIKTKSVYSIWYNLYVGLDKTHKYTVGQKIDLLFTDIIESISVATFLDKSEKAPWIRQSIRKLDTLKVFMMILWENKSISHSAYAHVSVPLEEIGKMLGGWYGQVNNAIKKPTS